MSFNNSVGDCKIEGDFSKLEKLVKNLGKKYFVDIGVLGEGSYEDGATIAGIGAVHEFGSINGKIPQRSFIKMPILKKQEQIEKEVAKKFQTLLKNGDIEGIFKLIGIVGEAAIQEAFETGGFGTWQDIAEITKIRKGSDSILIDESELRRAITSKVGK